MPMSRSFRDQGRLAADPVAPIELIELIELVEGFPWQGPLTAIRVIFINSLGCHARSFN